MSNRKVAYKPVSLEIEALAAEYSYDPEAVLEILKELDRRRHLNPETIIDTARLLNIPSHQAFGVATFYSMLSLEVRRKVLRVCDGPICWLKRAEAADQGLQEAAGEDWTVERSSCLGLCDRAPSVLVEDEQAGPVYSADAQKVCEGWRGVPTDYARPRPGETRVLLSLAGKIDPDSIEDALAHGVYAGAQVALARQPGEVITEVEASGLQGRGGAGFPVGRKWRFVAVAASPDKYLICNADESEPLIFKDRVLIDSNPHQLIAGMIIGAYACGASAGVIYIRGEYEPQARRLEGAIAQANARGWLGTNIQDSGFNFNLQVHRGAGAYICGEETALIESLEGKRGEPRLRPPFPPEVGFRGMPTAVNNVESFCAVTHILDHGADWWKSFGSVPGTKLYMVLGQVRNPGLFEAPFGLTLRQVIEHFGGGMPEGSTFNFALTGGAAGTLVNADFLDVPVDYASAQSGIALGAGAFLICDQAVSPIAFLRELLRFFTAEACGKCTPCRVGTWRSLEILTHLAAGEGLKGELDELRAQAENLQIASFCGLGQSIAIPVNSALANFSREFSSSEK